MDDLADWEDHEWARWALSCRRPAKIPNAQNGVLIEQEAFALTVRSFKRLKIASDLIRHYDSVSIEITAPNMKWPVLKSFDLQSKAMQKREKNAAQDMPKLTKNTTVPRWNDSLKVHLKGQLGSRGSTLLYLTRE